MLVKKRLWLAMILLLLASAVIGCNFSKRDNTPMVVDIWTYYRGGQKASFEGAIETYNRTLGKEKHVIVKNRSFGNVDDLNDNLLSSAFGEAGSRAMPDMFITYKGIGRKVNENYKLVNFEAHYTEAEIAEYVDDFIDVGYITEDDEKKLIMFPIAKSSDILLLNDTAFKKFMAATGVSYEDLEEYDDLVETAQKYYEYTDALTPEPNDGKAFFGVDSVANYFIIALKQMGLDMLSTRSGNTVLNLSEENARKIWDNYYVPVVKGYAGKQGNFVSEDIKIGKLILGLSYTTSASYFPKQVYADESAEQIELKVMHSPYMKGGYSLFINQGGGIFVVDGDVQKITACLDFVKWITSKENNLDFTIKSAYFPVTKKSMKKDVINKYEEVHDIDDNIVKTLNVGINQFKHMQAYTPEALDGYEDIRLIIEKDFAQFAKDDAKAVREKIESGESYQDALAEYLSDEHFEKWYDAFTKKINLTLQNYSN